MIGLTLLAVLASVLHPVAWTDEEFRLAVGGRPASAPSCSCAALATGRLRPSTRSVRSSCGRSSSRSPLALGVAVVYGLFWLAGSSASGRSRRRRLPDDPAALLNRRAGRPPAGCGPAGCWACPSSGPPRACSSCRSCVYVISYMPWAALDSHQLVAGLAARPHRPDAARAHRPDVRYHNNLTSAHAARRRGGRGRSTSSRSGSTRRASLAAPRRRSTTPATSSSGGSACRRWPSSPGRRSSAGARPGAHRDRLSRRSGSPGRASTEPRSSTTTTRRCRSCSSPSPTSCRAVARASRRTWFLAKAAAALAILAPAALWLFTAAVRVRGRDAVNPAPRPARRHPAVIVLTWRRHGARGGRRGRDGRPAVPPRARRRRRGRCRASRGMARCAGGRRRVPSCSLGAVARAGVARSPTTPFFGARQTFRSNPSPCSSRSPCLPRAARPDDSRRAAVRGRAGWSRSCGFIVFYPNISALPLPSSILNAYQGLLPTYLYDFQFCVSTIARSSTTNFATPVMAVLVLGLLVTCLVVAYCAWSWRIAEVERRLYEERPAGQGRRGSRRSPS